ncbi:hypothetical protein [Streptomyces sp. NPDC059863]|uniref:hypothetical protein n=1 Tax=unclassified Streptomyces TaxID=2593676 RepID=UPI00365D78EB
MSRKRTPSDPHDTDELTARIAPDAPWRLRAKPGETWLSRWAPYPSGVYRGPFAPPTPANLKATLAGLERLSAVLRSEETTAPAVQLPALEPVPVPECVICNAAHNGRSSSRAREDVAGVRKFSGIIFSHPHRGTDEGAEE